MVDEDDDKRVAQAEQVINEGEAEIKLGEETLAKGERELEAALHHEHSKRYPYTVDGATYETESKSLTGLQIKSKVPNVNLAYQLVEESRGSEPDQVIGDNDTVRIDVKPAPALYLVPPATFG